MKRAHISLKTKLASALLQMLRHDGVSWVLVIPYDEAKRLTDDEVISRFEFDHGIPHSEGGPDAAWNLTPISVADHKRKTATRDIPRIAKNKRIQARERGERKPRTLRSWRKFNGAPVYADRAR